MAPGGLLSSHRQMRPLHVPTTDIIRSSALASTFLGFHLLSPLRTCAEPPAVTRRVVGRLRRLHAFVTQFVRLHDLLRL
ncbi:hypothetical protein TRIUR3_26061 [Triticum urartu]|uniref:Uncharacterized protein n=1 Tax=Triticum urartu TaxID=4572 RepID=M7ZNY6_TRIUA|nr:hypothetical protein TRIUR3_26061 [Triticum urartu]